MPAGTKEVCTVISRAAAGVVLAGALLAGASCGHHTKWTAWMQTGHLRGMSGQVFRVRRVLDGRAFFVTYRGGATEVALAEVQAPSVLEPGGEQARRALAALIQGMNVRIEMPDSLQYDDNGRPLVRAYLGEKDVATELRRLQQHQP